MSHADHVTRLPKGFKAAASISSLAIEYYLNKEIKRKWLESYVLKGEFIEYETE